MEVTDYDEIYRGGLDSGTESLGWLMLYLVYPKVMQERKSERWALNV